MTTSALVRSRRAQERVTWAARGQRRARLLACAAVALAVIVLLGWITGVDALIRLSGSPVGMKLNTALAVLVLASSHLVTRPQLRRALLGAVAVFACLVLAEYLFSVDLHFDQLLVQDHRSGAAGPPGRPAAATAVSMVLLATAGLLADRGRSLTAQVIALAPLGIGTLTLYGHLYGVSSFYATQHYSSMGPPAAVATVLLSLATMFAVPAGVLQWVGFGKDPGAALLRLLIPFAVVVLPAGGWLVVEGDRRGYYDPAVGSVLLVVLSGLVIIVTAMWAARVALGIDDDREQLLEQLGQVNHALEDRVRARSHELNRQRTKLVLLEERDRIARDLHDRVIQRIFAAGLQVDSLGRLQRKQALKEGRHDSVVADSLDLVAIELDLAIRELRNSIFELTSIDDHEDVAQVVRDIAARAARILGFMPRVEVSGQIVGIRPDLVAQLASVIQEALSNIARHAGASAAAIALSATDDHVELCVSDNGIGLPDPLPRSSGISNLLNRARHLNGTATWAPNAPTGTVMIWRVPRDFDGFLDGYGNDTPVALSESVQSPLASSGS
jgi:signal transduction histidine kinase